MTLLKNARWLVVVLAVVGLVSIAPAVSAHGAGPTADDTPPYGGTADEWTAWMEAHMTQHMGPGAVEWMESHMGVTVEEMGEYMAGHGHRGPGTDGGGGPYGSGGTPGAGMAGNGGMYGGGMYGGGTYGGGMYGPGRGC